MSEKDRIKRLLKEAEIYRTQGLLSDSKAKYLEILSLIGKNPSFSKNQNLVDGVKSKIRAVEKSLRELTERPDKPELTQDMQRLIKKLFTFSQTKEAAAIEGAVALAKFGQYDQALNEFHSLLEQGILPVITAKNIVRCYVALRKPDAAAEEYAKWLSRDLFSFDELKQLRTFIKGALEKEGIEVQLPEVTARPRKPSRAKRGEETFLEISAVSIHLQGGPFQNQTLDFEVQFQSANTVTVHLPSDRKEVAEFLAPGTRLDDIQCYSTITVFRSSGTIAGTATIKHGPKQGDYTLDISIDAD
jgi:tetratricopeptide (TPR) repeat protein